MEGSTEVSNITPRVKARVWEPRRKPVLLGIAMPAHPTAASASQQYGLLPLCTLDSYVCPHGEDAAPANCDIWDTESLFWFSSTSPKRCKNTKNIVDAKSCLNVL